MSMRDTRAHGPDSAALPSTSAFVAASTSAALRPVTTSSFLSGAAGLSVTASIGPSIGGSASDAGNRAAVPTTTA
ncbi:hypothetical protein X996_6060 [Burkholderia pseudomallei A79A]|nr:hypothetical protein X996_6060 [Burkholderia pseudomallei A79A]